MLVLLYQIKVFIYDKYMPQQFTTIFQAFTLGGFFFLVLPSMNKSKI